MAILEPKNLKTIWSIINPHSFSACNPYLRACYFRIRNTKHFYEDYLITSIFAWMQGEPNRMTAIKCGESTYNRYQLDCYVKEWSLLSTKEEIEYLAKLPEQMAIHKVKSAYKWTSS